MAPLPTSSREWSCLSHEADVYCLPLEFITNDHRITIINTTTVIIIIIIANITTTATIVITTVTQVVLYLVVFLLLKTNPNPTQSKHLVQIQLLSNHLCIFKIILSRSSPFIIKK